MRAAVLFLFLLLLGCGSTVLGRQTVPPRSPTAAKPRKARGAEWPPLDFSGVWELDPKMSAGGSWRMADAVLSVRQKGNRIFIEPIETKGKKLLAEEIVADGRPYEKMVGTAGKGLVTAQWSPDGKKLFIEITAGPPENPREAIQHSVWELSSDGTVWIRESVSVSKKGGGRTRLVFRKRVTAAKPTPAPKS